MITPKVSLKNRYFSILQDWLPDGYLNTFKNVLKQKFDSVVFFLETMTRTEFPKLIKTLVYPNAFHFDLMFLFNFLQQSAFPSDLQSHFKTVELILKNYYLSTLKKIDYIPVNANFGKLEEINAKLYPYQLEALKKYVTIRKVTNLRGMILAFDQGLGKTLTAIALSKVINAHQVLIVCPNSLKPNWKEEILKFDMKVNSDMITVIPDSIVANPKYIIVNFESLNKVHKFLRKSPMLIADESHYIRNIHTKRVTLLSQLQEEYKIHEILLMSGTPIAGKFTEFAPYLKLLDPFMTDEFIKRFIEIYKYNSELTSFILKNKLKIFMVRKLKTQVLKLPPKYEITLRCKLDEETLKKSKILLKAIRQTIIDEFKALLPKYRKLQKEALKKLYEIYQKHFRNNKRFEKLLMLILKCQDKSYYKIPKEIRNAIVNLRTEILKEIKDPKFRDTLKNYITIAYAADLVLLTKLVNKHYNEALRNLVLVVLTKCTEYCKYIAKSTKTIFFTNSAQILNQVAQIIEKTCGFKCMVISREDKDRLAKIKEFVKSNAKVLVTTYALLGVGFTITEADTVILVDLPFRDIYLKQAVDRIYRIGQTKPVKIITIKVDTPEKTIQMRREEILNYFKSLVKSVLS